MSTLKAYPVRDLQMSYNLSQDKTLRDGTQPSAELDQKASTFYWRDFASQTSSMSAWGRSFMGSFNALDFPQSTGNANSRGEFIWCGS